MENSEVSGGEDGIMNSSIRPGTHVKIEENTGQTPSGVVEISPYRRYIRFNEVIGQTVPGSISTSFRAFDTTNAIEVDWHIIDLSESVTLTESTRIRRFIEELKNIQNTYIQNIQNTWLVEDTRKFNIITSHLPSLKEFMRKKGMTLRWKVVKKWCTRILRGLEYLHNSNIVHRNLNCSNIYINSGTGDLCIGDTWLCAILLDEDQEYISFTDSKSSYYDPLQFYSSAFLSPEIFEQLPLSTMVDIYSFGICTLEIITRDEPYRECQDSIGRIAYRATHGVIPLVLNSVSHSLANDFIKECLRRDRPSATDLLKHPFLLPCESEDDEEINPTSEQTVDSIVGAVAAPSYMNGLTEEEEFVISFEKKLKYSTSSYSSSESISSLGSSAPMDEISDYDLGGTSVDITPTIQDRKLVGEVTSSPSQSQRDILDVEEELLRQQQHVEDDRMGLNVDDLEVKTSGVTTISKHEKSSGRFERPPIASSLMSPNTSLRRRQGQKIDNDAVNNSSSSSSLQQPASLHNQSAQQRLSYNHSSRQHHRSYSNGGVNEDATNMSMSTPRTRSITPRIASLPVAIVPVNNLYSPYLRESVDGRDRVEVRLQIPGDYSKDGQSKEVEFVFNRLKDRYEVVAREMIDELELTVPVEVLASKIEEQVNIGCSSAGDFSAEIIKSPSQTTSEILTQIESNENGITGVKVEGDPTVMIERTRSLEDSSNASKMNVKLENPTATSFGMDVNRISSNSVVTSLSVELSESNHQITPSNTNEISSQQRRLSFQSAPSSSQEELDSITNRGVHPSDPSQSSSWGWHYQLSSKSDNDLSLNVISSSRSSDETGHEGHINSQRLSIQGEPCILAKTNQGVDVHNHVQHTIQPLSVSPDDRASGDSIRNPLPELVVTGPPSMKRTPSEEPSITALGSASMPKLDSQDSSLTDMNSPKGDTDECVASGSGVASPMGLESPRIMRRGTENIFESVTTEDFHIENDESDDAEEQLIRTQKEQIDKDSRAARRAFEQRIQKHKTILETCDEDLLKNDNEHHTKTAELEKKRDMTLKKKEDEISRIYEEYNTRKMKLFERKREEILEGSRRRQQEQAEAFFQRNAMVTSQQQQQQQSLDTVFSGNMQNILYNSSPGAMIMSGGGGLTPAQQLSQSGSANSPYWSAVIPGKSNSGQSGNPVLTPFDNNIMSNNL